MAFDGNCPLLQIDELLDNAESQAGAGDVADVAASVKGLKQVGLIVEGNADAFVFDLNPKLVSAFRCLQSNGVFIGSVTNGVE